MASANSENATASALDASHAAALRSWVRSANGHGEFPIQNLPHGVFSPPGEDPRGGVAIGDRILDLQAVLASGLCPAALRPALAAAAAPELNAFLALAAPARRALRARLSQWLAEGARERGQIEAMLHRAADCTMSLPARIGDYTDFYAGIHHATNIGTLFRPENPLLPNYKHVPIGYHGRASSVRPSGTAVTRPNGQRKRPDEAAPSFGPCRNLDYELELGIWIGPGNPLGQPIGIDRAPEHIAGFCLLNDWSARDIQAWEYQPLGPFLAKSFTTTVSPWIVTAEALAPFRIAQPPRPADDPALLPYLLGEADQLRGAFAIDLEVLLLTPAMRENGRQPHLLSRGASRDLYWTVAQLIAHHSSNGCNLQPGDLLGSGTISGPTQGSFGSLMEITRAGREAIALPGGESRTYLLDGDEIVMRGKASREGFASIGFGECRARILPAPG